MPAKRLTLLTLALALCATPGFSLEVELHPGNHLYANRLEGPRELYDLLLQGVRVRTTSADEPTPDWIEIRATDEEGRVVTRRLLAAEGAQGPAGESGIEHRWGPVLLMSSFEPTHLEVEAFSGGESRAEAAIPVRPSSAVNTYAYPLRGNWYMRGIPSSASHHRWSLATEFAVDFFKVDAEGRIASGDRLDPTSYYGFGEPVFAAESGTVEMVIRGMTQDHAARIRRDGESREEYSARMSQLNQKAMQEHGLGGATGNLIVLRHPNGERTAYGHLKAGSLRVAEGDAVERGQRIAEVGDTGDSAAVHLHFQVMEGGQPMRSIPFRFADLRIVSNELGSWVEPTDEAD